MGTRSGRRPQTNPLQLMHTRKKQASRPDYTFHRPGILLLGQGHPPFGIPDIEASTEWEKTRCPNFYWETREENIFFFSSEDPTRRDMPLPGEVQRSGDARI